MMAASNSMITIVCWDDFLCFFSFTARFDNTLTCNLPLAYHLQKTAQSRMYCTTIKMNKLKGTNNADLLMRWRCNKLVYPVAGCFVIFVVSDDSTTEAKYSLSLWGSQKSGQICRSKQRFPRCTVTCKKTLISQLQYWIN